MGDQWIKIEEEYDISKKAFGKRINFITDPFKRKVLFRDIQHAYDLAYGGYNKPAVILVGGVIEELLKQYLIYHNIPLSNNTFNYYIQTCIDNDLLKKATQGLSDSIRNFRNLVHIDAEKDNRYTISKATAKGAVSSIFTIVNDFIS